jgi:hypothetical protein
MNTSWKDPPWKDPTTDEGGECISPPVTAVGFPKMNQVGNMKDDRDLDMLLVMSFFYFMISWSIDNYSSGIYDRQRLNLHNLQRGFIHLLAETGFFEVIISPLVMDLKALLKRLDSDGWTCQVYNSLYLYYHQKNPEGIDPATGSPK